MVSSINPSEDRFFIEYKRKGFITYVEVFHDFSCKCYHTVYEPAKTSHTLSFLENAAEIEAINKFIEVTCKWGIYDFKWSKNWKTFNYKF